MTINFKINGSDGKAKEVLLMIANIETVLKKDHPDVVVNVEVEFN